MWEKINHVTDSCERSRGDERKKITMEDAILNFNCVCVCVNDELELVRYQFSDEIVVFKTNWNNQ